MVLAEVLLSPWLPTVGGDTIELRSTIAGPVTGFFRHEGTFVCDGVPLSRIAQTVRQVTGLKVEVF